MAEQAIAAKAMFGAESAGMKSVVDDFITVGDAAVAASDDVAEAGGSFSNLSSTLKSFAPVAKGAGVALLAVAGAIGQSIGPAIRLEKQMAELAKLTGEKQAEPITASIMEMSNQMPVARSRLMDVAEAAARLGIRGTANITKFTEVMGMVGTATNATSQQAAKDFARIAAMTQTPIEDIDKLASTANQLSNTAAASFQEVSDATRRAAASMSNLGATAPEILALSTSVTEVSASARRSGTRLRRVAQQLQSIPAADLAKAFSDLSAEGLAQLRRNDPTQLILKMAEAFRTGGRSAKVLRDQMTSASEQAFAALAVSIDQVRENLKAANVEWNDANSLSEEYAEFQDTAAARTQMLKNSIENTRAEMGTRWLPVIKDTMDAVRGLSDAILDFMTIPFEQVFPEDVAQRMQSRLAQALADARAGRAVTVDALALGPEAIMKQVLPVVKNLPGPQVEKFRKKWNKMVRDLGDSDKTAGEFLAEVMQMIATLGNAEEGMDQMLTTSEKFNKGMENMKENLNLTGKELDRFEQLETKARAGLKTTELQAFASAFFQASTNVDNMSAAMQLLTDILADYGVELGSSRNLTEEFNESMDSLSSKTKTTGLDKLENLMEAVRNSVNLTTGEVNNILREFVSMQKEGRSIIDILDRMRFMFRRAGGSMSSASLEFEKGIQMFRNMGQTVRRLEADFPDDLMDGPVGSKGFPLSKEQQERMEDLERMKERFDLSTMQSQMDLIARTARDMAGTIVTAFNALFDETKDAEEALESFFTTLGNQLARQAISSFLFNMMSGAFFGGGGGGNMPKAKTPDFIQSGFGGVLGHGGPVSPNKSYVVGDRGPEVFVPDTAGTIIPNDQLGGGGQTVVKVDQNFQLSAIDERGMSEMIQRNKGMIARATIDAVNRSERASKRLNTRGRR